MIGLDTNVLARYYTAASSKDDAATARQCEAARDLIESGKRLMVSQTVLLELEWVLRGAYGTRHWKCTRFSPICWAWVRSPLKTASHCSQRWLPCCKVLTLPMRFTTLLTAGAAQSPLLMTKVLRGVQKKQPGNLLWLC